jgi:aryl-alcohol dehydrogenase-like predicted oxidoreductase
MSDAFLRREVPALGRSLHRLGLAVNYGMAPDGVAEALERGLEYVFWPTRPAKMVAPLKQALRRDRARYVLATGPTLAFFRGNVRRSCERILRKLEIEYIDVFHLFWVGVTASFGDGVVEELVKLKEEGKVRAIGISIHDRPRAGKLAADSPLDLFMIRYNAAHPGAEADIFPHLAARRPAVVAYTATSWRKLLKAPRGWQGRVATAGDCYRFCLSSPHVDVVLTGPASREQLAENLAALERGPLSPEEMSWMRDFGRAVHG